MSSYLGMKILRRRMIREFWLFLNCSTKCVNEATASFLGFQPHAQGLLGVFKELFLKGFAFLWRVHLHRRGVDGRNEVDAAIFRNSTIHPGVGKVVCFFGSVAHIFFLYLFAGSGNKFHVEHI